jgi:thiol-disulfide isomerase/thioredoxin
MALIGTSEVELGFNAPEFQLLEPRSNQTLSLENLKGEKGTLVMFICNHCPYVVHLIKTIVEVADEYIPKGVAFIAINSNDVINYPADSPEKMIEFVNLNNICFPYLYDESQEVAKSYFAQCTPDFNLIDSNGKVIYRGRFDAATPGNDNPVNGADLRSALDRLIQGNPQKTEQIPSMGCSIKWK